MKYYLHDTNAFQDEKITELFMTHGYEGLGLFYCILEKLAHQEKPIKTAVLKRQLYVGKKLEKCWAFMEEIGIISSNNGETFNNNLLKFSEKYQVFKEKNRERVAHWRESQADTKPVTHYVPVRNAPKVNISKVNISTSSLQSEEAAYAALPEEKKEHFKVEVVPADNLNALTIAAHTGGGGDLAVVPTARPKFAAPTADQVLAYMVQHRPHNATADVERVAAKCFGYYASNGWKVGRNPMKDWNAACQTFLADLPRASASGTGPVPAFGVSQVSKRQALSDGLHAKYAEMKRLHDLDLEQ